MIGKPGAIDADRLALSAGVWRYHPTQHRFEIFAYGGSNQWGLDYDDMGQMFMTHCRSFWDEEARRMSCKAGTTGIKSMPVTRRLFRINRCRVAMDAEFSVSLRSL